MSHQPHPSAIASFTSAEALAALEENMSLLSEGSRGLKDMPDHIEWTSID